MTETEINRIEISFFLSQKSMDSCMFKADVFCGVRKLCFLFLFKHPQQLLLTLCFLMAIQAPDIISSEQSRAGPLPLRLLPISLMEHLGTNHIDWKLVT
jgi:hypothetical protein